MLLIRGQSENSVAIYNIHNKATILTPFGKYIKIRRCRTSICTTTADFAL